MNRDEKTQMIAQLTDGIGSATNAFVIDFKGITVPQVTEGSTRKAKWLAWRGWKAAGRSSF